MTCRAGCGACCIAPSISSLKKPAGVPCQHLDSHFLCRLWGDPRRPAVCSSLQAEEAMCGAHRDEALERLARMEQLTLPD